MIITSVGHNEQRASAVVRAAHLAEPQIDGVQERPAAFGRGQHHLALKVFNAVRKRACEFGALIKAHEEEFVLGIACLEELYDRLAGPADFVRHAAAVIENDAHRNRNVFGGKSDYFLLDIVLKHAKATGLKTRHGSAVRISNGHIDHGEVHIYVDALRRFDGDNTCITRDWSRRLQAGHRWASPSAQVT